MFKNHLQYILDNCFLLILCDAKLILTDEADLLEDLLAKVMLANSIFKVHYLLDVDVLLLLWVDISFFYFGFVTIF